MRERSLLSRCAAVTLIFVVAATWWISRNRRIAQQQQALAEAQVRLQQSQAGLRNNELALQSLQEQVAEQREQQLKTRLQVKIAETELAQPRNNDNWSELPAQGPSWIPESPYVWFSKKTLMGLVSQPFGRDGTLRREFADAMAISEEQRRVVDDAVRNVVAQFRALEGENAARTVSPAKHPGDSPKITVTIPAMPEQSARLLAQVEATLASELGEQRKELLMSLARIALETELNGFGKVARSITAQRRARGSLDISYSNGSSMSGPTRLSDYIPPHLLPFFVELEQATPDVGYSPQ